MKNKFIGLMLFLMCLSLTAQELTFRGYNFGTLIDDVIAKEGTPTNRYTSKDRGLLAGDEGINFDKVVVANHYARMELEFKEKKFVVGSYDIILTDKTLSQGIKDPREVSQVYNDLVNKLASLYGKPVKVNNIELLDGAISDMLAQDINKGAPYSAQWEYQGGSVMLVASIDNRWSLGLIYVSPETYKTFNKAKTSTDGL